jgi:aldose 1-epimerase
VIGLRGGALDVAILPFGATIQRLRFSGRDVILGFDTPDEYVSQNIQMGAVVGRFANRIADGRFTLDGRTYQLTRNENGINHLHGGVNDFSRRIWTIDDASERAVTLSLVSPDGEEGYPGTLTARCRYSIEGDRCLRITLSATTTDAPTIVNLATHSYFNLDGAGDTSEHRLEMPANSFLPTNSAGIPTGKFASVSGTAFDFRTMRPLHKSQRYDHTFVFPDSGGQIRKLARLEAATSGIALEVWSTERGLQLFDAVTIPQMRGRNGATYGPYSALCLEPQRFPDSPNQPGFTNCRLDPGEEYRQITDYRFDLT